MTYDRRVIVAVVLTHEERFDLEEAGVWIRFWSCCSVASVIAKTEGVSRREDLAARLEEIEEELEEL